MGYQVILGLLNPLNTGPNVPKRRQLTTNVRREIPQERGCRLHRCGSLKSRADTNFFCEITK